MWNRKRFAMFGMIGATALMATAASAATSLGVNYTTLDPVGWSVGDADTTHQLWDAKQTNPDTVATSYNVGGASLTASSHAAAALLTGTDNYYSFGSDFAATVDVYSQGGTSGAGTYSAGYGTHVIVQIAGTLNEDSVVPESLKIVDLSDQAIIGGGNAEKLYAAQTFYDAAVATSIGAAEYEANIWEFWLPGYTGDFRVAWEQTIHSTLDVARVDSAIVQAAQGGSTPFGQVVPEPASLALLACGSALVTLRRRRAGA